MTLSHVGSTTWVSGTGAVTPTLHASTANGDLVIITLQSKYDDAVLGSDPSGWNDFGAVANTGRSTGTDNGNTRTRSFWRIKDASWSAMPSLSPANNNVSAVKSSTYRSSFGPNAIQVNAFMAADNTTGSPLLLAAGSTLGLKSGDILHIDMCLNGDVVTWGTTTISATGATFGTMVTNVADGSTTSGTDMRFRSVHRPVTSGTASGNPQASTTLSGTTTNAVGTGLILRIYEDLTQTVSPTGIASGEAHSNPSGGSIRIALICASVGTLELNMEAWSEGLGHPTQAINGPTPGFPVDPDEYDVVWISANCDAAVVSDYVSFPKGVICFHNNWNSLQMSGSAATAGTGATSMPLNSGHPANQGSSSTSLWSTAFSMSGRDVFDVVIGPDNTTYIGSSFLDPDFKQVISCDDGQPDWFDFTNHGRRVCAGFHTTRWQSLNVAGRAWFEGVLNWVAAPYVAPAGGGHTITISENSNNITTGGIASAQAVGSPALSTAVTSTPTSVASAEAVGNPTLTPKITASPAAIASAQAMGSPMLTTSLLATPSSITSAQAFGNPVLNPMITASPSAITSLEALGNPSALLSQFITPSAIASAEALGQPALSTTVVLTPTGIASAQAFGNPTLTTLLSVSPTAVGSAEAFGSPTISVVIPSTTLSPTAISSLEAFGTPVLSPRITLTPSAIPSAEAFGTPSLSPRVTVSPGAIASAEAMGNPVIATWATVSPTGIVSAQAFGAPSLTTQVGVIPSSIASAQAMGSPAVAAALTVVTGGIASAEAQGAPSLSAVVQTAPIGVASAEALGLPTVNAWLTVTPTGVASAQAMGNPTLVVPITVTPVGIVGQEAVSQVYILSGLTLVPTGIASAQAFGAPVLSPKVTVSPTGIVSAQAMGNPALNPITNITPFAIASGQAFGNPALMVGITARPGGVASVEAFGSPTINAIVTLIPISIETAEAFGGPSALPQVLVIPAGVPSAEGVGQPSIKHIAMVSVISIDSGEAFGEPVLAIVAVTWVPASDPTASLEDWGDSSGSIPNDVFTGRIDIGSAGALWSDDTTATLEG